MKPENLISAKRACEKLASFKVRLVDANYLLKRAEASDKELFMRLYYGTEEDAFIQIQVEDTVPIIKRGIMALEEEIAKLEKEIEAL